MLHRFVLFNFGSHMGRILCLMKTPQISVFLLFLDKPWDKSAVDFLSNRFVSVLFVGSVSELLRF